ncbi:MAG TPA: hypothetical protein VLH15_01745 [Dehalococcoidales bacterium]|nr:hypothetical protein [Dehalococcoidales bacterium]
MLRKLFKYAFAAPRVPGKGSYFASLAVFIILLYVVNNLRYMGITQLNEPALISCLWSLNIVFGLAIVGNFILLLYRPVWFFYLVQTLISAAVVNAFWFMYFLFPFEFNITGINTGIRVIIIFIMICSFLAFLLDLYYFGIHVSFKRKRSIASPELVEQGENNSAVQPQPEQLTVNSPPLPAETQTENEYTQVSKPDPGSQKSDQK